MELKNLKQNDDVLDESKQNDLFMSLIMGKDATDKIETSKGVFEIKFPRAKDIEDIGRRTAFRLNGIAAKCFDYDTYTLIQMIATLDVLVVSGPSWYEKAKKRNINFSWQDIPTLDFIREVYAKAYNFRQQVQEQLESNKDETDNRMVNNGDGNSDSQPGLFENMSGETGIDG